MAAPYGNQHNAKWTPERDIALGVFLACGMSHSEAANAISVQFHISITRNSSIGRANRLGIRSIFPKVSASRTPVPKKIYVRKPKVRPDMPVISLPALRCSEVEPRHVSLLEVSDNGCRWPFGDRNFTFCDLPQIEGSSYCGHHFVSARRSERT